MKVCYVVAADGANAPFEQADLQFRTLLPPTIAASSDAASSSSDFSSCLKPAASSDAASPSADFIALFLRFQFLLPLSFDFTVSEIARGWNQHPLSSMLARVTLKLKLNLLNDIEARNVESSVLFHLHISDVYGSGYNEILQGDSPLQ
ncbi:hypothetical protein LXL04_015662 [Taraxacum kok-saghyz]